MLAEVEFFTEIFEEFLGMDNHLYENELWKANSIIKLMNASDEYADNRKRLYDLSLW